MQVLVAWASVAEVVEPGVIEISAVQRWPWEEAVDIDYTLVAETNCDIRFAFDWRKSSGPVTITNAFADATVYGVPPGKNHFTWIPSEHGFGGKTLGGFMVTATEVVPVSERTYIVLDLSSGDYTCAAEPPEETWTNSVYKTTKMVFRRCPAGTYSVGHTEAEIQLVKGSAPSAQEKSSVARREVKLSSDWYIAIFPLTYYQVKMFSSLPSNTQLKTFKCTFDNCRGQTNSDDSVSINWPISGLGRFGTGTLLASLRERTGGKLMIDLPTETQWEVAMRAGTTTILPNGGTSSSTQADLRELWLDLSIASNEEEVGLRQPNAWGIYNSVGMAYYWCLDAFPFYNTSNGWEDNKTVGQSGTDPYGQTIAAGDPMVRICRGTGWAAGVGSVGTLVGHRRASITSSPNTCGVRLAIHLSDPRK